MRIKWTVHPKCSYSDWCIGTQHIIIIIWNFFLKPLTSIDEIKRACEFPLSPNTYLASFSKVNENRAMGNEWVYYLLSTATVGSLPCLLDVIGYVRMAGNKPGGRHFELGGFSLTACREEHRRMVTDSALTACSQT